VGVLAVGERKNPKNSQVNNSVCEIAHARKRNPLSALDKTLQSGVGIRDIITDANLGDNPLKGLGLAGVKFCPSP